MAGDPDDSTPLTITEKAAFPDGLTIPDDDDEFERELMEYMTRPIVEHGPADPDCHCICHEGTWLAHHFGGPCCANPHGRRS